MTHMTHKKRMTHMTHIKTWALDGNVSVTHMTHTPQA